MNKPLKPVSEAMRRALALLGETPEEHQREKTTTRQPSRGRQPFVSSKLESTASVAARLISKIPEPVWLADARVLFTRTRVCRCCGSTASEMHYTETFIRMRSKDDARTIKYIPARSSLFANLELPKLTVNENVKTFYCPACWADESPLENPVCLSELVTSPSESTESSSDTTAQTNGSAGTLTSEPPSSPNLSGESASDSYPGSVSGIAALTFTLAQILGSTFGSSGDAPSASARLTPIPIG